MAETDPFILNVLGVEDLVKNKQNKVLTDTTSPEGAESDTFDIFEIKKDDKELLKLRNEYEQRYAPYESVIKPRQMAIRNSYLGKRPQGQWIVDHDIPLASNIQFEAEETFLAAALSKNPEPVVYCDNTPEGNAIANAVKTMLQYHADHLALRRRLTVMVRQWSMDLIGVLEPGWNDKTQDVTIENGKVRDYVFDPDGYVDVYGNFTSWWGRRKTVTAERLIELFPDKEAEIMKQVAIEKKDLGTRVTYTEWWPNGEYCFYTFKDIVLDKHKNQYFNYAEPVASPTGEKVTDPMTGEPAMTKPRNHFAYGHAPAIFLSVYSLQEQPHDITSNTEQNISQQNRITRRTDQVDSNVEQSNNGYAFSEDNFNQETAKQAAAARAKRSPILIPSGGPIEKAIFPLNAQPLPEAIFKEIDDAKNDLRTSWGVQGITAQPADEDQTARGMILNQAHDTSRIGGGIGDAIEQVADTVFNWLTQLYTVFYDEKHFAVIMGSAKAVEYIAFTNQDLNRQVVVSVAPDSMKPKDEITQMNQATQLFQMGAIGPKTLLTMLDFPDPQESAADGVLWKIDPMTYFKMNFPDYAQQLQQVQQQDAMLQAQQGAQAEGMKTAAVAANTPPEAISEPTPTTPSQPPASSALSNVPLPK